MTVSKGKWDDDGVVTRQEELQCNSSLLGALPWVLLKSRRVSGSGSHSGAQSRSSFLGNTVEYVKSLYMNPLGLSPSSIQGRGWMFYGIPTLLLH